MPTMQAWSRRDSIALHFAGCGRGCKRAAARTRGRDRWPRAVRRGARSPPVEPELLLLHDRQVRRELQVDQQVQPALDLVEPRQRLARQSRLELGEILLLERGPLLFEVERSGRELLRLLVAQTVVVLPVILDQRDPLVVELAEVVLVLPVDLPERFRLLVAELEIRLEHVVLVRPDVRAQEIDVGVELAGPGAL